LKKIGKDIRIKNKDVFSMQNQRRKSSNISNQPIFNQLLSVTPNTMKSTAPVRIHLTVPADESPRPSFDLSQVSSLPSTVTMTKNKLKTNTHNSLSPNVDGAPRGARFSSVSSSYAQFLKQRDMDKVKKIVSHRTEICFLIKY
jgi:hypothetical protein